MLKSNDIIVVVFMFYLVKGLCGETSEETRAGVEYIQIFRNMPTLFEYFLDVLHQRVEVLERNDVTPYQRKLEITDEERDKRDANNQCIAYKDISLDNEQYFDTIIKRNTKTCNPDDRYKRDNSYEDSDHDYTTLVYEYGRSSGRDTDTAIGNHEMQEDGKKMPNHGDTETAFIHDTKKRHVPTKKKAKNKHVKKNKKSNRERRHDREFEKYLAGIDWSRLSLTSDEVANQAIRTDQILEEQHKKNKRK